MIHNKLCDTFYHFVILCRRIQNECYKSWNERCTGRLERKSDLCSYGTYVFVLSAVNNSGSGCNTKWRQNTALEDTGRMIERGRRVPNWLQEGHNGKVLYIRNGVCEQIDQRTEDLFTFLAELDRLWSLRSPCRSKDDVLMSVTVFMSMSSLRTMSVGQFVGFAYWTWPNYSLWNEPSARRITGRCVFRLWMRHAQWCVH